MGERRSALVLGASGLVGAELVRQLCGDARYGRVVCLVRRPLPSSGARIESQVIDFDSPPSLPAVDDVFCCLGTTIKRAGSQEAFRRVDLDYPVSLGRAALSAGARRMLLVTSVGAAPNSRIFYSRIKGQCEQAVGALPFPAGVGILRPSILLGEREERRPGEAVGQRVMQGLRFALVGALTRYRGIGADEVARALRAAAHDLDGPGVRLYEGATLFAAARRA